MKSFKKLLRDFPATSGLYHSTARLVQVASHYGEYREARRWEKEFDRIIAFFGGIGDELMLTTVLRGLKLSGFKQVAILSDYPELFAGNPDVAAVLPKRFPQFSFLEHNIKGVFRILLYAPRIDSDRSEPPKDHVLSILCRQAGVTAEVPLRPFLHLTDEERRLFAPARETICIQTSNRSAKYSWLNKEWFPERFQSVADQLRSRFRLVQVGSKSDPLLDGVEDMRGRTSIRECAALLAGARLFIGLEGFLMHLARAVETRSVIVYGGRLLPTQIGYPCNENICTAPPCAPCWRDNLCEYDRECMKAIQPDDVIKAVSRALDRSRAELEMGTLHLP